jgi:hypothetical protein
MEFGSNREPTMPKCQHVLPSGSHPQHIAKRAIRPLKCRNWHVLRTYSSHIESARAQTITLFPGVHHPG